MKVVTIVQPNEKGQIVIPKKTRDTLGITPAMPLNIVVRDGAIHLYPVREILVGQETQNHRLRILKKTIGAWAGDDWPKTEKRRRRIELAASARRKKAW